MVRWKWYSLKVTVGVVCKGPSFEELAIICGTGLVSGFITDDVRKDIPRRWVNCIEKDRMSMAGCDGPGLLSCDAWLLWLPCLDVRGRIRDANDRRRCELSSELLDLRRPLTDNLICFSLSSRLRTSPSNRCTSYSLYEPSVLLAHTLSEWNVVYLSRHNLSL